jgi:hypothetical protein
MKSNIQNNQEALARIENSSEFYADDELNFIIESSMPEDTGFVTTATALIPEELRRAIIDFKDSQNYQLLIPLQIRNNHFIGIHIVRTHSGFVANYFDPTGMTPQHDSWATTKESIDSALDNKASWNFNQTKLQHVTDHENTFEISNHHCGAFVAEILIGLASGNRRVVDGRLQSSTPENESDPDSFVDVYDYTETASDEYGKDIRKKHLAIVGGQDVDLETLLSREIEDIHVRSESLSSSSRTESSKSVGNTVTGQQLLLEFFLPDSDKCIYFPEVRFLNKMEVGSKRKGLGGDSLLRLDIQNTVAQLRRQHNDVRHAENEARDNKTYNAIVGAVLVKFEISYEDQIDGLIMAFESLEKSDKKGDRVKKFKANLGLKDDKTPVKKQLINLKKDSTFKDKINKQDYLESFLREFGSEPNLLEIYQKHLNDKATKVIPIRKKKLSQDVDADEILTNIQQQYRDLSTRGQTIQQLTTRDIKNDLLLVIDYQKIIDLRTELPDDAKAVIEKEVAALRSFIQIKDSITADEFKEYKLKDPWCKDADERREAIKIIKDYCIANLSEIFNEHTKNKAILKQLIKQRDNFRTCYFSPMSKTPDIAKLQQDIQMIRGHSESELVNSIEIIDITNYDQTKVKKVYILLVSSNEICSACTNVIPRIREIAADRLKLKDVNKVQLLYFPIAEHEDGKLYIKKSVNEEIYKKTSSSAIGAGNVIFDSKQKPRGSSLKSASEEAKRDEVSSSSSKGTIKSEIRQSDGFFSQPVHARRAPQVPRESPSYPAGQEHQQKQPESRKK